MRFRPNPTRVRQVDLVVLSPTFALETAHVLQTQRHEFATFQLAGNPLAGFLVPSLATATLVERRFRANALGNVGRAGEAGRARVGRVGRNGHTAHAT